MLVCWKCGASLADIPLPFARAAECPSCNTDLHVCRMCEFYDTRVSTACREPIAEPVADKEKSNFCGYLRPKANAFQAGDDAAARKAKAELAALFGDGVPESGDTTADESPAERARREWEQLFGSGGEDADK